MPEDLKENLIWWANPDDIYENALAAVIKHGCKCFVYQLLFHAIMLGVKVIYRCASIDKEKE